MKKRQLLLLLITFLLIFGYLVLRKYILARNRKKEFRVTVISKNVRSRIANSKVGLFTYSLLHLSCFFSSSLFSSRMTSLSKADYLKKYKSGGVDEKKKRRKKEKESIPKKQLSG